MNGYETIHAPVTGRIVDEILRVKLSVVESDSFDQIMFSISFIE